MALFHASKFVVLHVVNDAIVGLNATCWSLLGLTANVSPMLDVVYSVSRITSLRTDGWLVMADDLIFCSLHAAA
jgi:hypothetical protein